MASRKADSQTLSNELARLRRRLAEAEETLRAIRRGEVDAIVVSGRKKRVFTLEGAEHPYRVFVESLNEGAVTLTSDGTIAYANKALSKMLGMAGRSLVGRTFKGFVSSGSASAYEAMFGRAISSGSASDEIELRKGRGSFPAYVSGTVLVTDGAANVCAIVTDLTGQKRNEQMIASELLTRRIIEQAGEAIIVCDRQGIVLRASSLAGTLAGRNPVGKNVKSMLALTHGRTGARFSWAQVLKGTTIRNLDVRHSHRGRTFDLVLNARPLLDAGRRALGSIVTLHDVTERRLAEEAIRSAEERFASVFRSSPVGLFITRIADGRFIDLNESYLRITGYDRRDCLGRTSLELGLWVNPADRRRLVKAATKRRPIQNQEIQFRRKSGEIVDVLASVMRFDVGGEPCLLGTLIDISERKRADRALEREREEVETILSSAPAMIFYKDRENRFLRVNEAFADKMGVLRKDVEGRSGFALYPRDQAEASWRDDQEVITSGKPKFDIVESMRFGGETRWIQTDKIPYRDAEGNIVGVIGFSVDITDRLAAERKYATAIHTSQSGFWLFDLEGKLLEVNEAYCRMSGYSHEELLNMRISELDAGESPDEILAHIGLVRDRGHDHFESRHRRRDGTVFDADIRATYLDIEGGRLVVFVWDISERKVAERRLHQLNRTLKALSESSQAMSQARDESEYLNDVCRIIVEDCGHAMAWIGLAEEDDAKTVRPVAQGGFEEGYLRTVDITWDEAPRGQGPTGTAIRTGRVAICRNMLTDPRFAPWRDEALRRGYASSIVLPLVNEGKAFGAISIYSKEPDPFSDDEIRLLEELAGDLSHGIMALRMRAKAVEAEEVLRRDKETLERIVRTRSQELIRAHQELERTKRLSDIGTLAATIAHELRNPLAAISMAAANIKRKARDPLLDKHLQNIGKKVVESGQIIDNLLYYSRIRPPHCEEVDVNRILRECAKSIEQESQAAKRVSIQMDLADTAGVSVEADPLQMKEVFWNVVNNAYDAVGESGGRIEIRTENAEDAVVAYIEDNGTGIPAEYLERVFDPFFSMKAKGTGLGLSVCRQIIDMHGGRISLESEVGKGTSVGITLRKKRAMG